MSASAGFVATLKEHLVSALATAALLGGGATVIAAKVDNARQDQQIDALAKTLPDIQRDVKATHEVVIRLEARSDNEPRK